MEAFRNMGNHLVSNSAAAINASDDISTVDPDESILSLAKGPRRRQHDDDETESIEEDDLESLASAAVDADGKKELAKAEEEKEKELPPHACAYVRTEQLCPTTNIL
jgi:regulator of nonsense transcripts 1